MTLIIEHKQDPTPEDREAILAPLRAYALQVLNGRLQSG